MVRELEKKTDNKRNVSNICPRSNKDAQSHESQMFPLQKTLGSARVLTERRNYFRRNW